MRRRAIRAAAMAGLAAVLVGACTADDVDRRMPSRSATSGPPSAATPSPPPSPTTSPAPVPEGAEIAFHSDPGGNDDTYLMRADGTHATGLTFRRETVAQPFWSPDGTRLALECCSFEQDQVLVVNPDGSGLREVSGGVPGATAPAWSPDGSTIAFESTARRAIFTVDVDASGRPLPKRLVDGAGPAWSPDGSAVAFFRVQNGNLDVFVLDLASLETRRLTRSPGEDFSPVWSPDSRRIAFVSDRGGDEDVWAMDADGSHQVDVSRDTDPDESVAWSPDGRLVAYVAYTHGADPHSIGIGDAEVFVVRPDGSGKRNVTRSPAWEGDPAWSPDGSLLAFTRRTDHAEISTIRPDGTGERFLRGTEGAANDCCAAWRPVNP